MENLEHSLTQRRVSHIPILTFPITQHQIDSWQPFCSSSLPGNNDCVASSLRFLGVIDQKTYENASRILNTLGSPGADPRDANHFMPGISEFMTIKLIIGPPLQINPHIPLYIQNNTGTICCFLRDDNVIGHAVVIARDSFGQILLLDPQKLEGVVGLEGIHEWIMRGQYNGFVGIPYAQEYLQIQGQKNIMDSRDEERRVKHKSTDAVPHVPRPNVPRPNVPRPHVPRPYVHIPDDDFPLTESFSHGIAPTKKKRGFRKGGKRTNKNYVMFEKRKRKKTIKNKRNNRRRTRRSRRI